MAAAVYLHNALFGQPSSSRSLSNDPPSGNAHDDTRGDSEDDDEEDMEGEEEGVETQTDFPFESPHLNLGSSRAPSSSSPFSTATAAAAAARTHSNSSPGAHQFNNTPPQFNTTPRFNTPPRFDSYADPNPPLDEQGHARGTSTSSQTTLVVGPTSPTSPTSPTTSPFPWTQPTSPFPWSQVQGHPWSQALAHPSSSSSSRERRGMGEGAEAYPPPWSQAEEVLQPPTSWSPAQAQSRARYYAQRSSAYQPTPATTTTTTSSRGGGVRDVRRRRHEGDVEHSDEQRPQLDLSTDIDTDPTTNNNNNNNNNNNIANVHVYTTHPDANEEREEEEEEQRDTTNPSPPPPPGLPPSTSRTSERRPLTPYPWPPISTAADGDGEPNAENAERRKSRSHSRGRPKGRRRDDASHPTGTDSNPANRSSVPAPTRPRPHTTSHPSHHPPAPTSSSSFFGIKRHHHSHHRYLPPYFRKGRIPNIAFSRCARIAILTFRFLLGVLLCGWAAYSCARYWLAYSEFRPVAASNSTDTAALDPDPASVAVEDPPRSQYAFALAITCTIATALLVLDSSYFLYFVLYPHDGRLLKRIPTIAPISRTNDEHAALDDVADDTDAASPPPRPRPRPRPQVPLQLQDDKFTSMPYRSSVLSTSSGFRRSRRLSKPRPDSFLATYPPVGREVGHAGGEEDAVREQAANIDTDEQEDTNTRPSRSQEQERRVVIPIEENAIPPPPSRFVEAAPSTAPGDESDPQVEKHSKRTYTLHLPSLCHEPSISPLPFPPTGVTPTQRDSTQHNDPPRRSSRKWRRTRMFLHVAHWLAFIAFNIPGFVNVGLVPIWYQPTQTTDVTGVNSPHRLSGLCVYSPDVIWAGTALPPSRPPPCGQTIPYKVWLWGAIGRVLVTFVLSGLWIIMDGVWWGAWVVGTRRIGWQGALGGPWRPRRAPRSEQQQGPGEDSEGLPGGEVKESPWAKRIRLLSGASKASGRSGRSGKSARSNKEKAGEFGARTPPNERGSAIAPVAAASVAIGTAAVGVGGITNFGIDPQDALSSPTSKHKVRRKPVEPMTPSSSSSNSPPTATYSLNSPPLSSTYGPGGKSSYFEQSRTTGGAFGSRRPSVQDSIGGSTVVGSPPRATYLPGSPVFTPASPPASSSHNGPGSIEEHTSFGNAGRRSMALEIVQERSSDERESSPGEQSPELERQYPDRPQSRLARYDDAAIFGAQYRDRPGAHSPPSSPTYPPSPTRPGWTADPSAFSPVSSPNADVPLLGRGYFMVGDGGFSAGNANDGAYDEDSYYPAMATAEDQVIPLSNQAGPSGANRATSPNSERSNSPNSYGHGQYAGVDVRVETPTNGGDDEYPPEAPGLAPATQGQWYMSSTSQQPATYQHPLTQGIQLAMGQPPEFEREVRMLGSVVRRMSTIESFGSHERELSRRGSAATARTTQTGRGNSGGTAQREGTNGSGNSAPMNALAMTSGSGSGDRGGGSGGQMERNPEAEASVGFVRATSPTDMSPV